MPSPPVEHRPYAVATSPELGRHWVATRDIAPGELLLEERPLVVGPKAGTPPAVCLTCYAPGREATCSACGWPVCGPRCETAAVHRLAECPLIAGHYDPARSAAYCFVAPLRCLLLDDPDRLSAYRSLQSHLNARLDTPLYRAYANNVAAFVLDRLGLRRTSTGRRHDDRAALEAAAVLDTNAFEVRRPGGRVFRAVYAQASMIAHSCTANTKHVFVGDPADGQPNIRVTATVPIGRGQLVTATYTQTLWCTRDRRRHLLAAKCFECRCPRCADPTELGTYLGSAVCAAGHDDDYGAAEAERHVRALPKTDCAGFERYLERVYAGDTPVHANHYVAVNVKYALAQLYGDRDVSDLTANQLELNTRICRELLRLADVLEPGTTRFRGLLLYYLVRGLKRARRAGKNGRMCGKTIGNYASEAAVILKTEPDLEHLVDQLL